MTGLDWIVEGGLCLPIPSARVQMHALTHTPPPPPKLKQSKIKPLPLHLPRTSYFWSSIVTVVMQMV